MIPKLIIVTGKGGVGKTTIAHSLTRSLISQGRQAFYTSFDQACPQEIIESNTPHFSTTPELSSEIYIGQKLSSPLIAKWVMKAPFFKALFQVLPPLGHMILLGHYIKELEKNPEMTIVVDAPASGHAMSMISSLSNFREIFKFGILVEDIDRMESFLKTKGHTQVLVSSIPTEMSLEEGLDLTSFFENWGINKVDFLINTSLKYLEQDNNISPLIQKKIELEKKVTFQHSNKISYTLPQVFLHDHLSIIRGISPYLKSMTDANI